MSVRPSGVPSVCRPSVHPSTDLAFKIPLETGYILRMLFRSDAKFLVDKGTHDLLVSRKTDWKTEETDTKKKKKDDDSAISFPFLLNSIITTYKQQHQLPSW
jgi:hypothetical protein